MAAWRFDRSQYGPAIADLLGGSRLPALGPGTPNDPARPKVQAIALSRTLGGRKIVDHVAASCCVAGLWLWHDFLDESHALSQEIDTQDASCWHAIMHRREPDYGNAKYWYRRVGDHPIFEPLAEAARNWPHVVRRSAAVPNRTREVELLATQSSWDPYQFVDLCEAIARGRSAADQFARQVARIEWQLLFDHCFRKAAGAS